MFAATRAGISVFATGGIGGVHRGTAYDVSADLQALAQHRMIVVCAGAKSILDLAATVEVLESLCVPVLGYNTSQFPAFYSRESGLPTSARADTVSAVVDYWTRHCALNMKSAVLVGNPIPEPDAIPAEEAARWIDRALVEAEDHEIRGQALTPYLLTRIAKLSSGRTLLANKALLISNARLAGEIAAASSRLP
jgi:pseudouridine-5'-phosphate glycosidase